MAAGWSGWRESQRVREGTLGGLLYSPQCVDIRGHRRTHSSLTAVTLVPPSGPQALPSATAVPEAPLSLVAALGPLAGPPSAASASPPSVAAGRPSPRPPLADVSPPPLLPLARRHSRRQGRPLEARAALRVVVRRQLWHGREVTTPSARRRESGCALRGGASSFAAVECECEPPGALTAQCARVSPRGAAAMASE